MLPFTGALRITALIKKGILTVDGKNRKDIKPGAQVDIVLKKDQRSGQWTRGIVKDILTRSAVHPHGIKVRLADGQIGRVKNIILVKEIS